MRLLYRVQCTASHMGYISDLPFLNGAKPRAGLDESDEVNTSAPCASLNDSYFRPDFKGTECRHEASKMSKAWPFYCPRLRKHTRAVTPSNEALFYSLCTYLEKVSQEAAPIHTDLHEEPTNSAKLTPLQMSTEKTASTHKLHSSYTTSNVRDDRYRWQACIRPMFDNISSVTNDVHHRGHIEHRNVQNHMELRRVQDRAERQLILKDEKCTPQLH